MHVRLSPMHLHNHAFVVSPNVHDQMLHYVLDDFPTINKSNRVQHVLYVDAQNL